MDSNFRREIIVDNASNPFHKEKKDKDFITANTHNESCIDNIDLYVKVKDDKIVDAYFDGEACAISTSSCSIMIHNLIGKTIKEAKEYINNFQNMLDELPYNEEVLNEALAYNNIYKQNNRKHCAYLPYEGILKILNNYQS